MNILSFPDVVLESVLSYLPFDEVAKTRIVCKKFNEINKSLLNHGFYTLLNCHAKHLKRIKSQLPRRESERRNHPLSKHSDVLTCIETRLSMLSMTYQKYIQNGSSCFIPGKVIDECYRILRNISATTGSANLRAHEILQELRDISSMAIEHFDEKIVPEIKKIRPDANVSISSIYDMLTSTPRAPSFEGLHSLSLSRNSSSSSVSTTKDDGQPGIRTKSKSSVVRMYKKHSKIIKSQSKQISKMMHNLKSIKRRLDESEIKNREMTESIKQLKASPIEVEEPPKKKLRTATQILKRHLDE